MPSPKICDYCKERPADQTLFTTFMQCGEGNATKRNAHLCEHCSRGAAMVLDRIGMNIAFEGDGQLRWDALITLSDLATRSRSRRAMQRDDLLLQVQEPSTAARAPKPTEAEWLSIIHELAVEEKLIESTVDRGREFWPEDPCILTARGEETASRIRERRRAEADGLAIEEWSAEFVPEQGTEEEFRNYADRVLVSPDGDRYDASDHVVLRRNEEQATAKDEKAATAQLFFEKDAWTTQPVRPVGYFFFENIPAIAFDADGVQILAEYYQLVHAVDGMDIQWAIFQPTPMNPMWKGEASRNMLRADSPDGKAVAFVSVFDPPGERSGIQALRQVAQRQNSNNGR